MLAVKVLGYPFLVLPVQFVAAVYQVSLNVAVAPDGAMSYLTFPSVNVVLASPDVSPVARTE